MVLFGSSPLYNTIFFYILFVIMIILFKPSSLYCHKNKRFKSFGCGDNETIFCFPLLCIVLVIGLYTLFFVIDIINRYISTP